MKKTTILFLMLILISFASAQQYAITGYVNDYSGILTPAARAEIETIAKELQDSGKAEYAVVIINSLDGQDIGSFSYNLGEGVLGDKEKNNGLLLVVSMEDRMYDIEVGRGLEPIIPDIIAGRIARSYLVPNFQAGDYSKGILETTRALKAVLDENLESEYYVRRLTFLDFIPLIIFFAFMGFIVALFISYYKKEYKKYKKEHKGDTSSFWTWVFIGSMMGRRRGRGGFGGGGFSGGGGFGGFSGGSFGGGGARGRW